ncbi:hypothetical protein SCALM49S_02200 [Streptomyces californicus]
MASRATGSLAPVGRAAPDSLAPVAPDSTVPVDSTGPVGPDSLAPVALGSPVPVGRAGLPARPGRTTRSTTKGRAPPR